MTRRIPRLAAALVSATLLATMAVTAVSAHDPGSDHDRDRDHGRGLALALDAVRDAGRFKDGHRGPWHDARPSVGQTALRFACDIDRATSGSSTSRT